MVNKPPVKIVFNYLARGFYCPSCMTGTYNEDHVCKQCGRRLLALYKD